MPSRVYPVLVLFFSSVILAVLSRLYFDVYFRVSVSILIHTEIKCWNFHWHSMDSIVSNLYSSTKLKKMKAKQTEINWERRHLPSDWNNHLFINVARPGITNYVNLSKCKLWHWIVHFGKWELRKCWCLCCGQLLLWIWGWIPWIIFVCFCQLFLCVLFTSIFPWLREMPGGRRHLLNIYWMN